MDRRAQPRLGTTRFVALPQVHAERSCQFEAIMVRALLQ